MMIRLFAVLWFATQLAFAAPKQVRVFVALCDNKTQGIMPVGAKIGNGDDPDANLYWGCSDGFGTFFRKSTRWKVKTSEKDVSREVLRRMVATHAKGDVEITADAYRGSEIRKCVLDFENAAASGKYDLVAYIGHNGLMDFKVDPPAKVEGNGTAVIVLCCMSDSYFSKRLGALGCKPVLMTSQFMYPGSFLLDAALESWRSGGSKADIRAAAGRAYAKNQKISVKAATGVFSVLEK